MAFSLANHGNVEVKPKQLILFLLIINHRCTKRIINVQNTCKITLNKPLLINQKFKNNLITPLYGQFFSARKLLKVSNSK